MIGYKRCAGDVIVKLEILGNTNENRTSIVNPEYAKYRTDAARVIELASVQETVPIPTVAHSLYDSKFVYAVGQVVRAPLTGDVEMACGSGIHYYKTRRAAELHAQTTPIMNGTWTTFYDTGAKMKLGKFCDGSKQGNWETWYMSGVLSETCEYVNGLLHGVQKVYLANGELIEEREFHDGVLVRRKRTLTIPNVK